MSDRLTIFSEADVLRELEALAPQVRAGFARAGGPSDSVLNAIHNEAVRIRRTSRLYIVFRRIAAAAAIAVFLTGAFQMYLRQNPPPPHSAHEQAVTLLRIGLAFEDESGAVCHLTDTSELAQLLLAMQGLDDDSYFSSPDETELLWL